VIELGKEGVTGGGVAARGLCGNDEFERRGKVDGAGGVVGCGGGGETALGVDGPVMVVTEGITPARGISAVVAAAAEPDRIVSMIDGVIAETGGIRKSLLPEPLGDGDPVFSNFIDRAFLATLSVCGVMAAMDLFLSLGSDSLYIYQHPCIL